MKLRIKGNSIRLRLTKTEVAQVCEGGSVCETLSFGGAARLQYAIEASHSFRDIQAKFKENTLRVLVPDATLKAWGSSPQVALKNTIAIDESQSLFILIEKDFVCLKPRINENEDESDLFDNPNFAHGSCG